MGNFKINTINEIHVSEFIRRFPIITGGNLLSKASEFEGEYRFFNMTEGMPIELEIGDNDIFCKTKISEKDKWVRLDISDVRSGKSWYSQKKNGIWGDWIEVIDEISLDTTLDVKVDKEEGKQLSDENYTLAEKQKLANTTSHFRGYFQTSAELSSIENPLRGDYAIIGSVEPSIWVYNGATFVDTMGKMFGDMLKSIYAPTTTGDLADRNNHHGQQQINTIVNLQSELYNKLDKTEKTKVIDNFNSTNPMDALSANCGHSLQQTILNILTGNEDINFQGNLVQNGHIKIGKLILQWGNKDCGVGKDNITLEINFNTPFTNIPFVVVATPVSSTSQGSGGDFCSTQIIDTNKFYLVKDYANTSNATNVQWFAIGV